MSGGFKVGDRVKHNDGSTGTVVEVFEDGIKADWITPGPAGGPVTCRSTFNLVTLISPAFKVGDRVRLLKVPTVCDDDIGRYRHMIGKTGTVARDFNTSSDVDVDGSGRWCFTNDRLSKIADEPKATKDVNHFQKAADYTFDPYKMFSFSDPFGFKSPKSFVSVYDPARPAPAVVSEHDELVKLRAERDSEQRWAAHWKGVADKREDEFKRAVKAELLADSLGNTLDEQDEKLTKQAVEIHDLKACRDMWVAATASAEKARGQAVSDAFDAERARDSALRARNIGLAVASSVLGSAGYVLYSCWGLL